MPAGPAVFLDRVVTEGGGRLAAEVGRAIRTPCHAARRALPSTADAKLMRQLVLDTSSFAAMSRSR
jgi:hypothetical protein